MPDAAAMLGSILDQNAIRRLVSYPAFKKATDLQARGKVSALRVSDDFTAIGGYVEGSGRQGYRVAITLTMNGRAVGRIAGRCECPVSRNCKHVGAVLLEALAQERHAATGGVAPSPAASRPATPATPLLSAEVQMWLEKLVDVVRGDDYPADVVQRLFYVLQPRPAGPRTPQLGLTILSVRLLKNGGFSNSVARLNLSAFQAHRAPKFYRDIDIDILRRLSREAAAGYDGSLSVATSELAERIVETGRAFWLDHTKEPLRWGPVRDGRIAWQLAGHGDMHPHLVVDGAIALGTEAPVCVVPEESLIGPVALGLPPRLVSHLLAAPPLAGPVVSQVASRLARTVPDLPAHLLPAPPAPAWTVAEDPVPLLRLGVAPLRTYRYGYGSPMTDPVPVARPGFRYGPIAIGPAETAARIDIVHDGHLYEIVRRPARERAALKALRDVGLERLVEMLPMVDARYGRDLAFADPADWLDFVYLDVPALRAEGFEIEIDDAFPFRIAPFSGAFEAEIESSGIDWFELGLGVEVEGQRIDLAPLLAQMIRAPGFDANALEELAAEEGHVFLPLADGRLLAVTAARLVPLLLALHMIGPEGVSVADGKIRISHADVAPLLGFEGQDLTFRASDRLRRLAGLVQSRGLPAPILPDGFGAVLRPYQAEGVAWLDLLRESGLGGILADDMGLGKTVQVLALIAMEKARGAATDPVLIVAPTSLMANWRNEARRFAPDLKVLVLHGPDRKAASDAIAGHDVVLTTYPLIARDHTVLLARDWHMAILDEAQTIKNPNAATTRWLAGIRAGHRFCLTGTPMENHLGELWSLMSFANPGFLGDKAGFAKTWRTPIEKRGDVQRSKALARRVRPFLLRRAKAEVAGELPPKTEMVETILIEGGQRDLYDSVRIATSEKVRKAISDRGLAKSHIIVLEALLKLRQVCCDPRLLRLDDKVDRPSAKLERLIEMVDELLSEGRKIIVFSQFTSMLALIRERFDARGIRYSLLTGQTKDRAAAIDDFQAGANPVFLISLKAGGVGLNLTAADTVIIFDPWWNPAVEEQAIDRAYRIGQDKAVFVYRLVAAGTIEEKMDELKARKRALADGLFDKDGRIGTALTEEDVTALFAE